MQHVFQLLIDAVLLPCLESSKHNYMVRIPCADNLEEEKTDSGCIEVSEHSSAGEARSSHHSSCMWSVFCGFIKVLIQWYVFPFSNKSLNLAR